MRSEDKNGRNFLVPGGHAHIWLFCDWVAEQSFILSWKSALLGWQYSLSAEYIITFQHDVTICQSKLWCSVSWECDTWNNDWQFGCFLSMTAIQKLNWNQTQITSKLFAWESLPSFTFHTWGFVLLILNKKYLCNEF